MKNFLRKYFEGDKVIWIVFFGLCVVSIIEHYSASSQSVFKEQSFAFAMPVVKHILFLFVGLLVTFGVHRIPVKVIRLLAYLGLLVSFILLIYMQFKGIRGEEATRSIKIFVEFQPAEIAKLSLVVFAADMLSRIKDPERDEKPIFWWLMGVSGVICALIFKDGLSTSVLLFFIVMILCFIQKISWKRIGIVVLSLFAVLAVIFLVAWNAPSLLPKSLIRSTTWVNRIKSPEIDNKVRGRNAKINANCFNANGDTVKFSSYKYVYRKNSKGDTVIYDMYEGEIRYKDKSGARDITNVQPMNSKIAIALGLPGRFPGNSIQRNNLPKAYSDYIYAIIIEETGIFGGIIVILLYLILLFRAGRIATRSTQVFPAMLVFGVSLIIVIQALVHMLVVTDIGPVTGQPLPLISRGVTSMIITCAYFGILLGVTREMKKEEKHKNELVAQNEEDAEEIKLDELDDLDDF